MSEGPWIRFFPSHWLAGTRGMSAAETGIYITLIAMMYERGEPLADDRQRLARLCGTTPAALRSALDMMIEAGKIELVEGGLWNEKVGVETEFRREKSSSARESAEKRWKKKQQKQPLPDASAVRSQSDGNANHNQVSDSSSLRSEESARARHPNPSVVLQNEVDAMSAQSFVAHCAEKRKPLSSQQAEQLCGVLRDVRIAGGNPSEALSLAIRKGWTSFELDWLRNNGLKLSAPPAEPDEDWHGRLKVFGEDGTWSPLWGPKPGEAKCRVPKELMEKAA
jgi:uncharacterized protein YdaU (DUF1376 family)